MIGFIGQYESTIDAKGRFLLPADFKKQLPDQENFVFVINMGIEKLSFSLPDSILGNQHFKKCFN